jgi:RecB family exonuclease
MSTRLVSYSELDAYRQCRHKHQLAYKERWKPSEQAPALARGTLFHEVMEAHYRELKAGGLGLAGPSPVLAALDVLARTDNVDAELVEWIYRGYIEQYGFDQDWEIIDVERKIEAWLPTDRGTRSRVKLKGKIDLIIRVKGELWVVDHKTCWNLPKGRETDLDDQMALYIYLIRREGVPVRGAIMNYCRTQKLKTRDMAPDERWARVLTFRPDRELETIAREARELMAEAWRRKGEAPRSPNPDTCRRRCPYLEACLHGRKGGDERGFLSDGGYVQSLERH